MITLTKEQIKEIAEHLDCGFRCFINKKNGELLTFPDELKHPGMEPEHWKNEFRQLKKNFDDLFEIDPIASRDSFNIMADFAERLSDDNNLKSKLIYALNRNKPFREFKFVIDNSGEYRQQWFDFKTQRLQEWVVECVNSISEPEE